MPQISNSGTCSGSAEYEEGVLPDASYVCPILTDLWDSAAVDTASFIVGVAVEASPGGLLPWCAVAAIFEKVERNLFSLFSSALSVTLLLRTLMH